MTRLDALRALLTQVEAGTALNDAPDGSDYWWNVWPRGVDGAKAAHAVNAFSGSLDAAKALHEAVASEWDWEVDSAGSAILFNRKTHRMIRGFADKDPARAHVIAIIRALIAEAGE